MFNVIVECLVSYDRPVKEREASEIEKFQLPQSVKEEGTCSGTLGVRKVSHPSQRDVNVRCNHP